MLEFTLKFLSGDSRKYEVDESTNVRQFKERLRDELNIPIERQRLIFQGKVLQDDTKLIDSNIQNKTVHFVERAEPIPPPGPTNASGSTLNSIDHRLNDGGINQAMMDEVNETTSIFINAFPGAANLQPNDIQNLVQNLLNDLGDVGRQAQVNTTMASDGHGVDINIDFGNIHQILEQQEINERFRSIGRMLTRLKLRIDRIEQIVQSNFRLSPTPPPPPPSTSERTTSPPHVAAAAATTTTAETAATTTTAEAATTTTTAEAAAAVESPPPPPSTTSSTTFLGMEDITSTEMDVESQGSIISTETLHTPPTTAGTTPVENASPPSTTNNNPAIASPRTARDLAELMNTIDAEHHRLQGYHQTYLRTIAQTDAFEQELHGRQRFYSLYNEATHLVAHIYHNITDFTLDLNDPLETRLLHLGELPISQAGLASIGQNSGHGFAPGQEVGTRVLPRTSRSIGRRPTAVATARIMGPIQISAGTNPALIPGEARMPFQNPMGAVPRMVFNATPRSSLPIRPPTPLTANNGGMQQSMRFNLGTLPYTFMQMGPDGITLNQVSASVVADVQTANSSSSPSSSPSSQQQSSTNRPTLNNIPQGATHVISSGPIQINGGQLDNNLAAEIAQRVSNSVQQHFAQMVNQQVPNNTNINNQIPNNNNNNILNATDSILRSTFVLQPDSSSSSSRNNETLRSRSADSRPTNNNTTTSTTTSSIEDDEADWIDLPSMDLPMPPQQHPNPPIIPMPRLRGPAIIQSIDRSLPCASPYFTQTLRPPFDNPNNAANLTPTEAAALQNTPNRAVIFATAPQRPRGRHRHPAGPWAQLNQQQQQQQMQNFMLASPNAPTGATVLTPAGHAYNMTAHSFEIPMVISTTTTAEIPQQQTSNDNSQQQQQQQQQSTPNDGQQIQMNAIISQVLSQILPGVLRTGNGRVRLNIGQNNPGNNNNPSNNNTPTLQSQASGTNTTQQTIPTATNIPGVVAGNLDFSNIARSIGSMVQGITGRLIPGATLISSNLSMPTTMTSSTLPSSSSSSSSSTTTASTTTTNTTSSSQNSNTSTSTITNNPENDTVTEQMLTELLRLLGGGLDNPELDNLTIGSFMQRFGEDVDARSNDGTNLISELFSTMTSRMHFTDVWNLVLGNPVGPRINQARQSATEYLQNTLLQGRPITPETLEELTDRLYESLLQEAAVNFNELRVKSNINIANVMKRFFRHHALKLLHILFDDPNNVWFERFRQQLITMRNEYLTLSSQCLEGGEAAAIDFILNRHRIIFRSSNSMIVTWSETYLRTSLTNAFNAIRSSPPNVSNYLIEPTPIIGRHVHVTPPSTTQLSSVINRTDHERETAATATTTSPSSPSWKANLPDDWIPIVVRDVNSQHDTPAQPPFSDTYKDGMPSKRRRVHMREDLTSSNLLQTLVLRASSASSSNHQISNGTIITPENVLTGEAPSPTLVNTFEQELKRLLEQRIRQDRDYPEVQNRMPNTKRYLDGDK
ncbi:unnamed protein product [Rotaria sordida]|uniref:Large proline-rich protein BAG6 n=1 Tax=Rotaria sordida TaxID=392033 RepID=A0A814THH4_9BILA|nr:unnamed protein product [Rotaria sordida]CAF3641066.1 unnamed protein product [Rotaria sordida]